MALSEKKIGKLEEEFNGEILLQYERKRSKFFGLPLSFTKYYLTEKRFVLRTGFFNSKEDEILLYRVLDTSIKADLWQKIIKTGTVELITSDKNQPHIFIKDIKNMRLFKNQLSEYVEKERLRIRFRTGEFMDADGHDECMCDHDH